MHITVLPSASSLFLVFSLCFGCLFDGLAVGNLRRFGVELHAIALLDLGEHNVDMEVAHAGEDAVVGLGVLLKVKGTVLFKHLVERIG